MWKRGDSPSCDRISWRRSNDDYVKGVFKALSWDFCFSGSWTSRVGAIGLIAKGLLPAAAMITHRLPLAGWQEAFRLLEDRQAVKVILIP